MMLRWARAILARAARPEQRDEVVGDLEEAHRRRLARSGRVVAHVVSTLDALDMAFALWRLRLRRPSESAPLVRGSRAVRAPISWLDFRLGLRMLVRYPGVTLVGGLAIAVSVAIGASLFQFTTEIVFPNHPYEEPERIVGILTVDSRAGGLTRRVVHDLGMLRERMSSIEQIGGRHRAVANLDAGDGRPEPVASVQISAVAFQLAPAVPVLGRPLVESDETPNAEPVAVLSHDLWRSRFGGAPDVVGRLVRIGGRPATIVGVMPAGYVLRLPSNDIVDLGPQDLWVPFRLDPGAHEPGEGPRIDIFGRLAQGVEPAEAGVELESLSPIRAADGGSEVGVTRRVATFSNPFGGFDRGLSIMTVISVMSLFIGAVVATLCANVALLLFARAAARESELVVRSALGASRVRIVGQLFAEALGLAAVGLVFGWVGASVGLTWMTDALTTVSAAAFTPAPPIDARLAPRTIVYAAALALAGAIVAGILPGLKATGKGIAGSLSRVSGRGAAATLDRTWGTVIVVQVALTATLAPIGIALGVQTWRTARVERGFSANEYVSVRVAMDGEEALEERIQELLRRLSVEPRVAGVAAGQMPGIEHPHREIEFESRARGEVVPNGAETQVATVEPGFFEAFGAEIVSGRALDGRDRVDASGAVVVNESFAREWFGSANAVGRRIRYRTRASAQGMSAEPGPWMEIVGVVRDLVMTVEPGLSKAGIYRARVPGSASELRVAVHVPDGPERFLGRLREVASEVSPELRVDQPLTLDRAGAGTLAAFGFLLRVVAVVGGLTLLLALAGIYAIMSFTVSRRTREIGVRVALGAESRDIAYSTVSRMGRRVGLGVLIGAVPGVFITAELAGRSEAAGASTVPGTAAALVVVYLATMVLICMTACVMPVRRALAIQPSQALSADV